MLGARKITKRDHGPSLPFYLSPHQLKNRHPAPRRRQCDNWPCVSAPSEGSSPASQLRSSAGQSYLYCYGRFWTSRFDSIQTIVMGM